MTTTNIPLRLKALREAAGLSIRELADKLSKSSSGYAHYETPARFKDDFLPMALARQLVTVLRPYGISPDDVLALAGGKARVEAMQPPGLAEAAAAPWAPPSDRRQVTDAMIRALAPTAGNPGTYRLTRDLGALGLLRGDVVIIDLKAVPDAGALALGNARTPDGDMVTVIGRFLPPLLFTPESLTTGHVLDVTNGDVAVYHPIVASFRSPITAD